MLVELSTKYIHLDTKTKTQVEEKLMRLGQFLPQKDGRLEVRILRTTEHHQKGEVFEAEARLDAGKMHIKAKAKAETVLSAVDKIKEEAERQLIANKEKHKARARNTRRKVRALRGKI